MGDYLLNSLFAANALKYFFRRLCYLWENPDIHIFGDDCPLSQFDEDICKALFTIWEKNYEDFEDCYSELWRAGVQNKESFGKYAMNAADSYFLNGYSPGSFLGYCAILLAVSTFYYEYPPRNGIPEAAAEAIALVLFAHQMTGEFYEHGGWDSLRNTSRQFNTCCDRSEMQNRY